MNINIEELRRLHAATGKMPWPFRPRRPYDEQNPDGHQESDDDVFLNNYGTLRWVVDQAAEFITTAHEEFPAFLDEIENLKGQVDAFKLALTRCMDRSQVKTEEYLTEIERLRAEVALWKERCDLLGGDE